MPFNVIEKPVFKTTAKIMVPNNEGGHDEETMLATFQVVPEDADQDYTVDDARNLMAKRIVRLDDLVDQDGEPLQYSEALRDAVLQLPYVRLGLIAAYNAAVLKAPAGN